MVSSALREDISPMLPVVVTGISDVTIPEYATGDTDGPLDVFFRLLLFFERLEAPLEWW